MEDKAINTTTETKPLATEATEGQSILRIEGRAKLSGTVPISGAKNAALAIMAGVVLCSETCRLRNVPNLVDIARMGEILQSLGIKLQRHGQTLDFDATDISQGQAPYEVVRRLRASFFVLGPLLARLGTAQIPLPGGCAIGARPVELHVRGLQAMGARVHIEHGVVNAYAPNGKLKGAKIYLDYPSVGATETLMMAATLAEGETCIENAAQEPEVVDLANFCRSMGARIKGAGTTTIWIEGVDKLHATDYEIIPDRIEAGTFMVAAAITQSELLLDSVIASHLTPAIAKLEETGAKVIREGDRQLRIVPAERILPTDIETLPHPGFPTDMQAQFMALLTLADGDSMVTETVFENRLRHVAELQRMGANIRVKGNIAIVKGVPLISGAPVLATDLRASAALVLAGLAAQGTTIVQDLQHLDRGYEQLEVKLQKLGAKLTRDVATS